MRKLLIANRGEVVRRIQRTCRAMGITTVAVHSDPDAGAPFVAEADEAVPLGGAAPADSYLRVDALLEAARRTGADAVHPGWGFLSESAEFARRCAEASLLFVGPPADVIAAMGSKVEARRRMQAAGVPVLPGHDLTGAELDAILASGGDLREQEAFLASCGSRLGYPLLVKASAGGGGKGMRLVRAPGELAAAVASAAREAASAFGDPTLFLERFLEGARHVEVQIFGDTRGRVVHLFERECSVQRRHQKIVEESPSPALDAARREAICRAAVAAGDAIGYAGAGTVEFVLAPTGEFFFLEVNTRLQVEHPVTELVTGLDLVRLQIQVARGEPLPPQEELPPARGHAIEARLYAEDPAREFLPSTGRLLRFEIPDLPGLRVDSGVEAGSEIGPHYDPMLAKLIAWAPSRGEAAEKLAAALFQARLHGVRTNRDLLVRILRHPEFLAGAADTGFLERHPPSRLGAPLADADAERLHALAAALAGQAARRAGARVLPGVPSGFRNVPSQLQQAAFGGSGGRIDVEYGFARDGGVQARVDGAELAGLRVHACTPDALDLETDGVRRRFRVEIADERVFVDGPLGASELRELPRFPEAAEEGAAGSLAAPLPGVVVDVRVAPGDCVEAGDVLLVLVAMKMEHAVRAPAAGKVAELFARVGDQVEAGRILAVIEETAP
jgi:acetyl/propionyl-CoA carboxylase alpha subunit